MNQKEKLIARHKLSLCLQKIIDENKKTGDSNLATSLRKLAAFSGVEYAIIQKISSGKKDPQYTTLVAIADGLGLDISKFLEGIKDITDQAALKHISKSQGKN